MRCGQGCTGGFCVLQGEMSILWRVQRELSHTRENYEVTQVHMAMQNPTCAIWRPSASVRKLLGSHSILNATTHASACTPAPGNHPLHMLPDDAPSSMCRRCGLLCKGR